MSKAAATCRRPNQRRCACRKARRRGDGRVIRRRRRHIRNRRRASFLSQSDIIEAVAERSPFPGMDPWLESYWGDVHATIITDLADQISAQLPAELFVRVEEMVYV